MKMYVMRSNTLFRTIFVSPITTKVTCVTEGKFAYDTFHPILIDRMNCFKIWSIILIIRHIT